MYEVKRGVLSSTDNQPYKSGDILNQAQTDCCQIGHHSFNCIHYIFKKSLITCLLVGKCTLHKFHNIQDHQGMNFIGKRKYFYHLSLIGHFKEEWKGCTIRSHTWCRLMFSASPKKISNKHLHFCNFISIGFYKGWFVQVTKCSFDQMRGHTLHLWTKDAPFLFRQ